MQQNHHHPCLAMMQKSTRERNIEPSWNNTSMFLGKTSKFLWNNYMPMETQKKNVWDFLQISRKRCNGTSFTPSGPGRSTRQFPSSKKSQIHRMRVRKCTNTTKTERSYHKIIAVIFASRLLQIGEEQWPHTNDVGYNIHRMRHTQVISQDGLLQSGATRRRPTSCLSAFQPIDNEFGQGKPVQTTEHTGNCTLQTPFKQAKIKELVVN